MKDLLVLVAHLITTIAMLLGPGGARAVVADSLLLKQQLLLTTDEIERIYTAHRFGRRIDLIETHR